MPIAQPQDHQSSDFRYTFKSGETLVLPRFASILTFGLARKLRGMPESEQAFAMCESVCTEEELAVLDRMDLTETAAFFAAWQADSGANLPESSGSSA